jgi:20S proteasome alpha/beta subunit
MTLVLAVAASDGVVLVADGQATAADALATRTQAQKLGQLHGCIAYGCAGSAGLRQRVVRSLEASVSPEDCKDEISTLRPKLFAAVNAVQQQALAEHVPLGHFSEAAAIELLFAGVSRSGSPWILEVTPTGGNEEHYKAEAIGIGKPYAKYALMSAEHYGLRERGLVYAQVLAYRAVDDAIRTAARDLGPPISVYTITAEGVNEISEDELKALRQELVVWQGHEREIFELVGGAAARRTDGGSQATGIEPPDPAGP